jgi:hypothetical protein
MATQAENAQAIWGIMSQWGATPAAIAGILGNMQTESGIQPDIWESGNVGNMNVGFGLVQWTPASKLFNWANSRGIDPRLLTTQMERIRWEADNGQQWYGVHSGLTFWAWMQSVNDPYQAAIDFLLDYERPANQDQPWRGEQARVWFDMGINGNWGTGGATPPPIDPPVSPPMFTSKLTGPFTLRRWAGRNTFILNCKEFPKGLLFVATIGDMWVPVWGTGNQGPPPIEPPILPGGTLLDAALPTVGMGAQTVRDWYNANIANIGSSAWDWCGAYCAYIIAQWRGSIWMPNLANAWAPNWPLLPGFTTTPITDGNAIACHDWNGDGSCDHVSVFDPTQGSPWVVEGNGASASWVTHNPKGSIMGYVPVPKV